LSDDVKERRMCVLGKVSEKERRMCVLGKVSEKEKRDRDTYV